MSQIINKVIFKYIILLLLSFASSVILVIGVHFYFQNLNQQLDKKTQNSYAKIDIARYLQGEISELHIAFLELTAGTRGKRIREEKVGVIREKAHEAETHIAILNYGGVFEKLSGEEQTKLSIAYTVPKNGDATPPLVIELAPVFDAIDAISRLLTLRDLYIETSDPKLSSLVSEIRSFNANLFVLFEFIEETINALIVEEHRHLKKLETQNEEERTQYTLLEIILLTLSAIVILSVIYRILGHIINLYKELENQLYMDALTKLKSRARLIKDIKEAKNPAIILIDINSFRTINELYGVEVGNEVLVKLARMLRAFAKNRDFKVYRISGDEFVFFKDIAEPNHAKCAHLLDTFFETTKNNQIFIDSLGESLYLDLSVGASFEKEENPLGTADIALNHAKQQHKPYVIFHKEINDLQEIAQGALWKKKIIAGIQNDAFLPFFQPIVDKNSTVVKYEALMRLEQKNGTTSYISPFEFLDIACKTRHYDEISQMTLLKSLHVSAQKQIDISLNFNYQDILNKPLHALLKERLITLNIAQHIVFEIVESQNIQNYDLLKEFIAEFRALGVRFAIDDFGTGFSNFSHIIELSPDYIKIDGSLIKHLDTDKTSYELVKAIVFFSKELGIQTIAEYVHSKEVFDVALELNIDLFQGYYFGKPTEAIAL